MTIPPNAYNPSLLRFQNRFLLTYRLHDRNDWRTSLYIAELDNGFKPLAISKISLPANEFADCSHEDARLFEWRNKLWMSWTVSLFAVSAHKCAVAYGQLAKTGDGWGIVNYFIPNYGQNNFTSYEKNWLIIPDDDRLWCLYVTGDDEQTFLLLEGARVEEVRRSKALKAPNGIHVHGGAICAGIGSTLLHFWNSHTEHRDRSLDRYRVGVAELSATPPFEMLRMCKQPIILGEEGYCLDKNPRYKANVAFVCGAVPDGGSWLVSYGYNDSACRIRRFTLEELKL